MAEREPKATGTHGGVLRTHGSFIEPRVAAHRARRERASRLFYSEIGQALLQPAGGQLPDPSFGGLGGAGHRAAAQEGARGQRHDHHLGAGTPTHTVDADTRRGHPTRRFAGSGGRRRLGGRPDARRRRARRRGGRRVARERR